MYKVVLVEDLHIIEESTIVLDGDLHSLSALLIVCYWIVHPFKILITVISQE